MPNSNPILFLLEDCPTTALIIERVVLLEMPEVRLLWARTLAEARARVEGLQIDLFLVDVVLPDGSGLDFLWKMAIDHPGARAIVMTGSPLPEYEAHSAALGVLHFLAKPVKPPLLVAQLRAALGVTPETEDPSDFRATLKNLTPVDVIQLKCVAGSTAIVEFVSGDRTGRIRLEDGEITDASTGDKQGVEAFYDIVGWKGGHVTEHPCVGFFDRTIEQSWESLLMDAAHRMDERLAIARA